MAVPEWRRRILAQLDLVLVAFDLVLCALFLAAAVVTGNVYLRGIGVGLLIAGVTAAVAALYRRRVGFSS